MFDIGKKVICIETPPPCECGCGHISTVKKGDIKTIMEIAWCPEFLESTCGGNFNGFLIFTDDDTTAYEPWCFRLLDDPLKKSREFADEVIGKLSEEIDFWETENVPAPEERELVLVDLPGIP